MSDLTCPACGHAVETLPDAVLIEDGPFAGTSKGHSDQSTHICPECGHEGWRMGWTMDGTPEADE